MDRGEVITAASVRAAPVAPSIAPTSSNLPTLGSTGSAARWKPRAVNAATLGAPSLSMGSRASICASNSRARSTACAVGSDGTCQNFLGSPRSEN